MEDMIQKILIEDEKTYIGCPNKIFIYSMDFNLLKKINGYRLKLVKTHNYRETRTLSYFA